MRRVFLTRKDKYLLRDYTIIKHIPHASIELPYESNIIPSIIFGEDYMVQALKMADLCVDQLFKYLDGIEIKAKYSRLYCDVERYKDDNLEPMARYGQGYMYTRSLDGKRAYRRHYSLWPYDPDGDVDKYYDSYHKEFTRVTKRVIASGKKALILDLHSFSEEQASLIGNTAPYPDICIGINEDHYDKEILELIIHKIEILGYSYKINYPYSGSIIPNHLSKKELDKVCSIMIEVNKRIYL